MTNKKQNVNPRILEYLRFGIYNQLKDILENIGDSLELKLNTKLILSHKKRGKKKYTVKEKFHHLELLCSITILCVVEF